MQANDDDLNLNFKKNEKSETNREEGKKRGEIYRLVSFGHWSLDLIERERELNGKSEKRRPKKIIR